MDDDYDESGVAAFLWFVISRGGLVLLVLGAVFIVLRVLGVVVSWAFWL